MKHFDEHYFNEARIEGHAITMRAEEAFVEYINTQRTKYTTMLPVIKAVVDKLKLSGDAKWIGRTANASIDDYFVKKLKEIDPNLDVNKNINKMPKTDFTLNEDKISLKLNRGWLFAHESRDSQACLEIVMERDELLKDKMIDVVKKLFGEIKRFEGNKAENAFVLKDEIIKSIKDEIFTDAFKEKFIQNALTGEFKFGKNNIATANKLLLVKYKNTNMSATIAMRDLNKINLDATNIYDLYNDVEFIKRISNKARVDFVIQKTGKARMDINSYINDSDMLIEGFVDDLVGLLKQGYEKAKEQIIKLFNKIIELINKSIMLFMKVVGLTIEPKFNNEIEF